MDWLIKFYLRNDTKQKLVNLAVGTLVIVLVACIPFGLFMAFYKNDEQWLWFCAPILVFLS
jgi:uncharacterized membrane protein YccC